LENQSEGSKGRSRRRPKGHYKKMLTSLPRPSLTQGQPSDWTEVATAPDRIAAGMLEGALNGQDIPVILQGPLATAYLGIAGVHRVFVPRDREQEAREILGQIWDTRE
jgi:hypothetical protein